jgi:glutathione peroxidase
MTFFLKVFILFFSSVLPALSETESFSFKSIEGDSLDLNNYRGKAILITNTASRCGFTNQYADLEQLHKDYQDKGLVVIAVPSNDFNQELSSNSKVKEFCNVSFGLTLPITEITSIRGNKAHPFYGWLKREHGFQPKWNFYKVLLDKNGSFHASFNSFTKPNSSSLLKVVDEVLKQP